MLELGKIPRSDSGIDSEAIGRGIGALRGVAVCAVAISKPWSGRRPTSANLTGGGEERPASATKYATAPARRA